MTTKRLREARTYFLDLNSDSTLQKVSEDAEKRLMYYNVAILSEAQSVYKRFLEMKRMCGEPKCNDTIGFVKNFLIYINVHSLKNEEFIRNVEPGIRQVLKEILEFKDDRLSMIIDGYRNTTSKRRAKSAHDMMKYYKAKTLDEVEIKLNRRLLYIIAEYKNLLDDLDNARVVWIE